MDRPVSGPASDVIRFDNLLNKAESRRPAGFSERMLRGEAPEQEDGS